MESKCSDETLRMRGMNLNMCILRMLEDTFLAQHGTSASLPNCRRRLSSAFFRNKHSIGKKFICKVVKLNVKQRRPR